MAHRIREGMREARVLGSMGGPGKIVEADETYVGGKAANRAYGETPKKEAVMSLVERGGRAASYHVADVSAATLRSILVTAVSQKSTLDTDESRTYGAFGWRFAGHETVNHSIKEYVRDSVHTNSAEGFFSILKRGIYGTYHHVSEAHLKRYLCEFDFRYNHRIKLGYDDTTRTALAVKGIGGKRLTYRGPHNQSPEFRA